MATWRTGAGAGRLLAVAAVIGQTVPLDLWATVGEVDEEALADVVGRATAARVLAETPDGQGVRFAHALVREALYEVIPLPRRRTLHRRVADALLATPTPASGYPSDPDMVAHHLRRAGDPRAAEWLVEAGHRAHRTFASRTAAERYEAALALMESGRATPGQVFVTVLEGAITFTTQGTTKVYQVGETFVELGGVVGVARNAGTGRATVLATHLLPKGAPFSTPVAMPGLPATGAGGMARTGTPLAALLAGGALLGGLLLAGGRGLRRRARGA